MLRLRDFLERFAGERGARLKREIAERDDADQPLVAIQYRQPPDCFTSIRRAASSTS